VNAAALIPLQVPLTGKGFLLGIGPFCGFLVCVFIWLNLNLETKLLGAAWVGVGLLLYLVMRKQKASGGVV